MTKLLVIALLLGACSKSDPPPPSAPAAHPAPVGKDPQKAREMIGSGAVVLDVRSPDEFSGAHLPTATNVPVDQVGSRLSDIDALVKGDKTKPIVVYCSKGGRAARAKQTLEAAGYTNVVNGGGYDDLN